MVKKNSEFPLPGKQANIMRLFMRAPEEFEGKKKYNFLEYLTKKISHIVKNELTPHLTKHKLNMGELFG